MILLDNIVLVDVVNKRYIIWNILMNKVLDIVLINVQIIMKIKKEYV